MIQQDASVGCETPTRVSISPNTAYPDDGGFQVNRGEDKRFDLLSAAQRERATQRLASLGEMTGGIVHDFRNILAVIESGLRLAEKHSGEPEKASVFIAGVHDGIDRGLKLTSQLLTFARQRKFEAREGDANELLRQLELFLRYGAGPGIHIVFELAPDIPNCLLDPSQFNAAILNLVVNARDAMPNGGELQISTARWEVRTKTQDLPVPGIYVRVRVKDRGQGMPPETLKRIFDPFFTTKGELGTGLGVPQVCAFMRLIGGHVSVASEREKGTTVDLLFPTVEPADV
jgi:signal transduction histidine kinase